MPAAPPAAPAAGAAPVRELRVGGDRLVVRPEPPRPPALLTDDPADALAPEQRQRLSAILALPAHRRLDALVESPDAAALVPAIPADAFAMTAIELGLGDVDVLLTHAQPEQLVHLADLSGWEGDSLATEGLVETLEALRQADPEAALRWVRAADDSLLTAFVSRLALIDSDDTPVTQDQLDGEDLGPPFSLDGLFTVFPRLSDHEGHLRWLLTVLFEQAHDLYVWLCLNVQRALPTETDEDARIRRGARLVEHGFSPKTVAAEIFYPVTPEQLQPVEILDSPPAAEPPVATGTEIVAAPPELPSESQFLGRCAASLAPESQVVVRAALDRLARLVVAAEGLDPGDPAHRRTGLIRAARTLSIGLEQLTRGDPALGAGLLLERPALELFRVGHTRIRELWVRATRIRRTWLARVPGGLALLDPELRRAYEAARHPRPQRWAGASEDGSAHFEPFASLAEVEAALRAIDTIDALGRFLAQGLGLPDDYSQSLPLDGCLPASWTDVSAADLVRTALVRGGATGHLRFEPVTAADLAGFLGRAMEPVPRAPGRRRLSSAFRDEALAALSARIAAGHPTDRPLLEDFLARAVDGLQDELSGLDPTKPVDLRFVGGLVRRV